MVKKLWGGRFKKRPDREFFDFQKSIADDFRLAEYDLLYSLVHVDTLYSLRLLDNNEHARLRKALISIRENVMSGKFRYLNDSEDIHTDIHRKVEVKVGSKLANKLHTLRSRNDLIVFDEKWYCWDAAQKIHDSLENLSQAIIKKSIKYAEQGFIGYTHTQRAQSIRFADYLSAFALMFERDAERFEKYGEDIKIEIGAGALTGTSLSRRAYKSALERMLRGHQGKTKMLKNPLYTVSERDFIIEFLSNISIAQMHLSRMAEDFILFSTKEFSYLKLPEEFCTGSSLMPHKKNPDFLELVRGHTGNIYGNLFSVLTLMKGLPLTYNRDMQLDKKPLFNSVDIILKELGLSARFISGIEVNRPLVDDALKDKSLYATELAEYMVVKMGVAFAEAHTIVGKLVTLAETKGVNDIGDLGDCELRKFHPMLSRVIVKKVMNYKYAVASKAR